MPNKYGNPINSMNQGFHTSRNFQSEYQNQPGYYANTMNFNPNTDMVSMLMNIMKGSYFPRNQPTAPTWMSQFDFERIRAQTSMRERTIGKYNTFNPIPIAGVTNMLGAMGFSDTMGLFVAADGLPTQTGKIVSDMFNRFMGPHAGPWSQMGTMQNTIRDVSMGSITGPGSMYRISGGLSNLQAHSTMRDLLKGTYRDDFFTQQRGMFGYKDMTEIYRMGRDYQVFQGAQAGDLAKRTQGFSRVIGQAMQTFGTPNKEQALQQLLESTGGSIALTNTGELQTALGKIKEVSRAANISMELLTTLLTRGSEVAKQLNMPGMVGTNLTLTGLSEFRLTQGRGAITGTPNQFLTPDVIASAGGQRRAAITYQDYLQQSMASTNMRTSAGLLGTFMEMGLDSGELRSEIRQGPITGNREQYYKKQIEDRLFKKFTAGGMNVNLARRNAVEAAVDATLYYVGAGQKEIAANMPLAVEQAQNNRMLDLTLQTAIVGDREDIVSVAKKALLLETQMAKGIVPTESLTAEEAKRLNIYMNTRVTPSILKDLNMDANQHRVITGKMMEDLMNTKTTMETRAQARKTADRAIIAEKYSERYRDMTTPLGRSISKMMEGGTFSDVMMAALPPTTDIYSLTGDTREEALGDLNKRAKEYVKTFGMTSRGGSIHQAYTNIMGRAPTSRGEAESFIGMLSKITPGKITGITEGKAFLAAKIDKSISKLVKRGNIVTIQDVLAATGGDINKTSDVNEALGILKTISPDSFTGVSGQIKAAKNQEYTVRDLSAGRLQDTDMNIDEINKDPRVKALIARIGIEFFPGGKASSLEQLLEVAEETGNETIINDAIALTGIGYKEREEEMLEGVKKGFEEVAENVKKVKKQSIQMLKNVAAFQPGGILEGADILIKERKKKAAKVSGKKFVEERMFAGGVSGGKISAEGPFAGGPFADIDTSKVDMKLLQDEAMMYGLPSALMKASGRGEISIETEMQLMEFVAKFKEQDPELAKRKFEVGMLMRVSHPEKRLAKDKRKKLLEGLDQGDRLKILEEGTSNEAIRKILGTRLGPQEDVKAAIWEVQESVSKDIAQQAPITAAAAKEFLGFKTMLTQGITALKDMFEELIEGKNLKIEGLNKV